MRGLVIFTHGRFAPTNQQVKVVGAWESSGGEMTNAESP